MYKKNKSAQKSDLQGPPPDGHQMEARGLLVDSLRNSVRDSQRSQCFQVDDGSCTDVSFFLFSVFQLLSPALEDPFPRN